MNKPCLALIICGALCLSACNKNDTRDTRNTRNTHESRTTRESRNTHESHTTRDHSGEARYQVEKQTVATTDQEANSMIAIEATLQGDLLIEAINHSALHFEFGQRHFYVDPSGKADWSEMPLADAIFITHEHHDHLDTEIISMLSGEETQLVINAASREKLPAGLVIRPGEKISLLDISVEAVAAYNVDADRQRYHPRDRADNGYVFTFGDKRVYVAGDTGPTPEMKALQNIDIAFLPINLPYTMPPDQAAEAARIFRPAILYPYHQGSSDPNEVKRLLADEDDIEVRVLSLP